MATGDGTGRSDEGGGRRDPRPRRPVGSASARSPALSLHSGTSGPVGPVPWVPMAPLLSPFSPL